MNLSAPRFLTFAVATIIAALAVASLYVRIPTIGPWVSSHRFWMVVAAYVILMLGVVIRKL